VCVAWRVSTPGCSASSTSSTVTRGAPSLLSHRHRARAVQRDARVAADGSPAPRSIIVDRHRAAAEPGSPSAARAQDALDTLRFEQLQRETVSATAAGRSPRTRVSVVAPTRDRAVLDERQNGILLRLVEPVDL